MKIDMNVSHSLSSQMSLDSEYLHDFITQVVDDFYGDAAGFWFVEWPGCVAV